MAEQQQKKLMVQVFFEGKNKKKITQNFEFVVIEDGNNPGITVRPVHTERDSELEDVDMRLVIDNEYNPVSAQVLDRENVMTKSNNGGGKGSRDDLFNDAINIKKPNENKQPESSSSHKPKERTAGTSKKTENPVNPNQVSRLIVSKPKNTLGPSNSKEKKSNVDKQPKESGQQQMQYEDRECEKLKHRRNSQHQEAFLIQTEHFADEESLSRSRKEHSESEFALIRPVSVDNPRSLSKSPNRQFRRQCLSPSSHVRNEQTQLPESIQGEPTEDQVHTSKKPHEEHKLPQADEGKTKTAVGQDEAFTELMNDPTFKELLAKMFEVKSRNYSIRVHKNKKYKKIRSQSADINHRTMYHLKKSKENRNKVFKSASQPNIHIHSGKNHQDKRNQITEKECVFCDGLFSMCSEVLKKNVLKIINDHFKVVKEVEDALKQNTQVEKSPKERLDTAPLQTNELHQEMVGKTSGHSSGPDKEPQQGKDSSPSNADYSLKMPLQMHCEKDCLCHEILIKVAEAIAAHSHFKDQEGAKSDKVKHTGKDTLGKSLKKRRKAYYKKKEDKYLIRNVKDQTDLVPKAKKSRNKGIDQSGTKRKNNIEDTTSSAYHELHNFKNKPTIEIPIVNDRKDLPKGTNATHENFNSETDSSTNDTSQMSDKDNGYLPNVYRERDGIQTDLSYSLSPLQGNEPKATHLENKLDSCKLEDRLISILQKIALIYAEHNRKKRHTVQNKPSSSHEDKDNFSDLDPLRHSYTEAGKEPKVALLYSELNSLLNETLRENSARCDKGHKCTLNQHTPTGYKNRRKCSSPWEKEDNFSDLESLRLIFHQQPSDVKGESKISEIVVSKVKSPRSANKQHSHKEDNRKKRNSCQKKLWPSPAEREEKHYDSDPLRDSSEVEMEPRIAELSSRKKDDTFDEFPRRAKDHRTTIKPHTPTDYEKKRKNVSTPHDRINVYRNKKFQESSEDENNNQSDKDSSEEIIHFIPSTPVKERKTHQKKMTMKKNSSKMKVVHTKKKMEMNDDTVDSDNNSSGEEYILLKRKKKQRPQEDSSSEDLYEVLRRPTLQKNKNDNLRNRRENKRKSIAGLEIPVIEKIRSSESLEEISDRLPEDERPRKQTHSPDIQAQQNLNFILINEQIKELEHLREMFLKCLNRKESPKIPDKKSKSGVRLVENERKSPEKHSEPESEDEGLKKQNQSLNNKNKQEMFLSKIEDQKRELQKLREQCLNMDRQIPEEDLKISDKKSPEKNKEGQKRAIKKSKVTIIPVRERLVSQLLNDEIIELFIAAQCPGLAKTPESKDDKQLQQTDSNTENVISPSKESMKTIHKTNDQVEMFNSVEYKEAMENTKDTIGPIKNIQDPFSQAIPRECRIHSNSPDTDYIHNNEAKRRVSTGMARTTSTGSRLPVSRSTEKKNTKFPNKQKYNHN